MTIANFFEIEYFFLEYYLKISTVIKSPNFYRATIRYKYLITCAKCKNAF